MCAFSEALLKLLEFLLTIRRSTLRKPVCKILCVKRYLFTNLVTYTSGCRQAAVRRPMVLTGNSMGIAVKFEINTTLVALKMEISFSSALCITCVCLLCSICKQNCCLLIKQPPSIEFAGQEHDAILQHSAF